VQRRDAIDRVGADHRQMRHAHQLDAVFLDQRAHALLADVAGPLELAGLHQPDVDVVDDLEMAREHALEQRTLHFSSASGISVWLVYAKVRVTMDQAWSHGRLPHPKDAQQLGDRHRRVRVVEMKGNLVREILQEFSGFFRWRRMMSRSEQETKKYCWTSGAPCRCRSCRSGKAPWRPSRPHLLPDRLDVASPVEGARSNSSVAFDAHRRRKFTVLVP